MEEGNLTDDEVIKITYDSFPRERAFFTLMRQSGLDPQIIKKLRIKNLEKILELDTPIPCKIEVPKEANVKRHPAFIAPEAIHYLKSYLEQRKYREKITSESFLFILHNKPNQEVNIKEISRTFKKKAHKIRKGKPDVQLSKLTEFFWKKVEEAKIEPAHAHYIIGDNFQPSRYLPTDDEFYRRLYEQSLMNYLEIEQINYRAENRKLNQRLNLIEAAVRHFLEKPDYQKTNTWREIEDPDAEVEKIEREILEFEVWEDMQEKLQTEQEAIQPQLDYEYEMELEAEAEERQTTPETIERERKFAQFVYERDKEREKEEKIKRLQEAFKRINRSRKAK